MKKIFLILSLTTGAVFAGDTTKPHTYEGAVSGVVCVSCKEHIKAALTKNLPGVVSVDVKPGEKEDTQKLIVVSTSSEVTKEAAITALGTYAKNYEIKSLERKN